MSRTREIYESAIKNLPDTHVKAMALRYARLERTLGEIDRARAIYAYASQFCDPRVEVGFWGAWSEFEVSHGNQETFKEMLRIKRSVLGHFAANSIVAQTSAISLTPEQSLLLPSRAPGAAKADARKKQKEEKEKDDAKTAGSKRRREEEEEEAAMPAEEQPRGVADRSVSMEAEATESGEINIDDDNADENANGDGANNDNEINIDDDDESDEPIGIAVKSVPDAVFGLGSTKAK